MLFFAMSDLQQRVLASFMSWCQTERAIDVTAVAVAYGVTWFSLE